jgi:hypothetical protein
MLILFLKFKRLLSIIINPKGDSIPNESERKLIKTDKKKFTFIALFIYEFSGNTFFIRFMIFDTLNNF